MQGKKTGKIRQIFLDNWESYLAKHPERRAVEVENVLKMLSCRTELMGYHLYICPSCSEGEFVPHSCKSRFCSVCGYTATDNWIRLQFNKILNCWYYHVVVTIPSFFRWMVKRERKKMLKLMLRCARATLREWCIKRGYEPATIAFFHSFGDRLQFHPHFHLLVSAGGLTPEGTWFITDGKLPGDILMPMFKAKFIAGVKQLFESGDLTTNAPLSRIYYQMNKQHDSHWQFYTDRITKNSKETMMYCVRYAKKMIISEKRILYFDHEIVIIKTKKGQVTYPVEQFISLVLQHIPEKHFCLISYDGFYANKSAQKYQQARQYWEPLSRGERKLTWRERQWRRNKQDPLICKRCKINLILKQVTYPKKWFCLTLKDIYLAYGLAVQLELGLNSS